MIKDDTMMLEKDAVAVPLRRRAQLVLLAAFVGLGATTGAGQALRLGDPAPDIAGRPWINSDALTMQGLRGRVVLVDFWTFG